MAARTTAVLAGIACTANVLFAMSVSGLFLWFVLPWEGGPQFTLFVLSLCWGYVIVNLGAMFAARPVRRIAWTAGAALTNLGILAFTARLLLPPYGTISTALLLVLVPVVVLSSVAVFLRFVGFSPTHQ